MKKKLAAMILTLALAAGVMAPVPAYADGITVEETSMERRSRLILIIP